MDNPVFAFTPPGDTYPPFLNIAAEGGGLRVTMRGEPG